jgi:YfiH family protein
MTFTPSPICPITHSSLKTPHGFFTRNGGVSQGIYASLQCGYGAKQDTRANIAENRRRAGVVLGLDSSHLLSVHQVHSARAVYIDHPQGSAPALEADAMVTNIPGLGLGILTADCGPVLLHDPGAGVIGAAHAGWRGAAGGVLEATVQLMEKYGAATTRIQAVLGPCISPESYEVGPEFVTRFLSLAADNTRFFHPGTRSGHALFDLPAYIIARLHSLGIKSAWTGHCTYADNRFFSNRRAFHNNEADYGRLLSAIRL